MVSGASARQKAHMGSGECCTKLVQIFPWRSGWFSCSLWVQDKPQLMHLYLSQNPKPLKNRILDGAPGGAPKFHLLRRRSQLRSGFGLRLPAVSPARLPENNIGPKIKGHADPNFHPLCAGRIWYIHGTCCEEVSNVSEEAVVHLSRHFHCCVRHCFVPEGAYQGIRCAYTACETS